MEGNTVLDGLITLGWIGFFVLTILKKEWFFYFDQRVPRISAFDAFIFQDIQKIAFMIARYILILVFLRIITMFLQYFNY